MRHIMVTTRHSNNRDPNRDKSLADLTTQEYRKLIGVKTMFLGAKLQLLLSGVYCLECWQYFRA